MFWSKYVLLMIVCIIPSIELEKIKHPVILVPGYGGSRVEAKINDDIDKSCNKTHFKVYHKHFTVVWLDIAMLIDTVAHRGYINCWVAIMKLKYNVTTHTTSNPPGVKTRIPGWGDPSVVEYLNPSNWPTEPDPSKANFSQQPGCNKYFGRYFNKISDGLVKHGWKKNVSIRGAPYDFRRAPNENQNFFMDLKALVEETYKTNNNTPVVLLAHSMGGPMSLYFLHKQTQAWKDKYIRALVSLAAVWGGSFKAIQVFAYGDDLGHPTFINHKTFRKAVITFPAQAWLLPSSLFWNPDEVLVETSGRNYTYKDMNAFFRDINYSLGWNMWKDVEDFTLNFKAPGVEVYCFYGDVADKTVERLIYSKGEFPDGDPSFVYGLGDGTVNRKSLEGCKRWQKQQKQAVYLHMFNNRDHMKILQKEDTVAYILKNITAL